VWLERRVGVANLAYAFAAAALSLGVGSPTPWLLATSFVHYGLYVVTFHERRPASFAVFVRDALFFQTLAMVSLIGCYVVAWTGADGWSLITIVLGFGLATLASARLGWRRTYFAEELGILPPRRIRAFPYGTIPHPMIVGAVVGLLGVELYEPVRARWPWIIPMHVAGTRSIWRKRSSRRVA